MAIMAEFNGEQQIYTNSVYQYDKGMDMHISGIELPEIYEVYYTNSREGGLSVACEGSGYTVRIPDELFMSGEFVYAYIAIANGDTGRETQFMVTIPVIPRPVPIPVQQGSGTSRLNYEIKEEEENLTFHNSIMNGAMEPNVEEDE